jgi:REP element-mobilizing transposase RayT
MANTYTSLFLHLVFSTKSRTEFISPDIEERVWRYLGGIARNHRATAIQIGGMKDHVHVLVMTPPTVAPFEIARYLKGDSSKWIHEEFRDLQDFAWQDGYGAFTVSKSNVRGVVSYIQNQRAHHQTRTFQEEYLEFLTRHGVAYDERYLWG